MSHCSCHRFGLQQQSYVSSHLSDSTIAVIAWTNGSSDRIGALRWFEMLGEVIRADTGHVGSLCNNGTKPLVAKLLGSGFVPDLKDLPQRTLKR